MQKLPKFGILTNPTVNVLKEIKNIAKLGFDFIELGIEEPEGLQENLLKGKNEILKLVEERKLFLIGHTAYWVHFGTSHEKARKGWVEEAKDMIAVASELKIKFLNFHFYGHYGHGILTVGLRKFLENFTESMRELNNFAKKKGITLMLENTPPREKNFGIKEFSYVIRNVPGLMVHFDVAHAFIEGGMKRINEYIKKFSSKIVHIHIHDNYGKEDDHLPIGKGKINFVKVVKMLKKINYDKTITLEVFSGNRKKDAVRSREKIKKLWLKIK